MDNILKVRLNFILKNYVTKRLREIGFSKNQSTYSKRLDEILWLINIEKSRWNDLNELEFTINCGIYVPGVWSIYANLNEPTNPKVENSSVYFRIGMLTPERKGIWWKLLKDDSIETDTIVAEDMVFNIEKFALPFLTKFKNAYDVATFLSSEKEDKFKYLLFPVAKAQRLAFAGIIFYKLGENSKAKEAIDGAVMESRMSPIEEIITKRRAKLDLST
jgi:Domain of unknown function (DUF4304)